MRLEDLKKQKLTEKELQEMGLEPILTYFNENWKEHEEEICKDSNLLNEILIDLKKEYKESGIFGLYNGEREIKTFIPDNWHLDQSLLPGGEKAENSFKFNNLRLKEKWGFYLDINNVFYVKDLEKYSKYLLKKQKEEQDKQIHDLKERLDKKYKENETLYKESIELGLTSFDKAEVEKAKRKLRLEKVGLKESDINSLSEAEIEDMIDSAIGDHNYDYH